MRGLKRLLLAAVLVAACARMSPPPGGPARATPPVLVGVFPDSGVAPCAFRGSAEFRFDEVTSDAGEPDFGTGTGTFEKLIMLSPDTAVPVVEWHRDRITVRPRGGWRPNTTYRIELLKGVLDLHQNTSKTGAAIGFTTCGPRPTRILSGRAIDWMAVRAAAGALIEAFHLPDSARYRTIADSTGRFVFNGLPAGPYLVVANADYDHNRPFGPGKAWDTVRVAADRDSVGEIWTFPRDTLPPRIRDATRVDSLHIAVTFSQPIEPGLRLDSSSVRVGLLPDTTTITPLEAVTKAYADSMQRLATIRTPAQDSAFVRDSLKKDSIARARPPAPAGAKQGPPPDLPTQKRPRLDNVMIIRTVGRVQPGTSYFIELRNVRTPAGRSGTGRTTLTTPKAPSPADSAKARADSLKAKARTDSVRKADSIRKATGGGTRLE